MDGWTDGRMDGWMDGSVHLHFAFAYPHTLAKPMLMRVLQGYTGPCSGCTLELHSRYEAGIKQGEMGSISAMVKTPYGEPSRPF